MLFRSTLLTGNEPGLLAYYPFNEATGTQVRDKTGNGNNGQIQGASWWGCAAPIGNLGHQVMQFDGTQTYIELPAQSIPTGDAITIEFWAKGGSSLPKSTYLIQAVNANNQRILSIYLPWGDSQIYFDCGTADCDRIQKTAQENNYKQIGRAHV